MRYRINWAPAYQPPTACKLYAKKSKSGYYFEMYFAGLRKQYYVANFSAKNCSCNCERSITPTMRIGNNEKRAVKLVDAASQTLSTGDIVITKIFFQDEQGKPKEKVLTSSPKRITASPIAQSTATATSSS